MADPPAPQDIARRSFGTSRRGYEQQEVRGFLHEVAALVERLTRSEVELRQRAELAEGRLGVAEHPDEATLLEVLGSETTRVLTSAHEAAVEVRSKAEVTAAQTVAEATAEVAEIRSKATAEVEAAVTAAKLQSESMLEAARTALERQTAEAEAVAAGIRAAAEEAARLLRAEADGALERAREEAKTHLAQAGDESAAVLETAREQGREMVAEASAVRERVLRDLSERRKRARQQVEKLNAGRERLLQAYELVRRTTDEATNELSVSIIDARVAANAAARRVEDEPEVTPEELEAEAAAAGLIDLPIMELDDDEAVDHADTAQDQAPGARAGEVPTVVEPVAMEPVAAEPVAAEPTKVVPDQEPSAASSAATAHTEPAVSLDDRRSRKGRRKKGFDGALTGELTVVTPPDPHEGVRILDAPPASEPTDGEPPVAADEPEKALEVEAEVVVAEPASEPAPEPVAESEAPADAAPLESADEGLAPADDVFARLRAEHGAAADDSIPAEEPAEPVVVDEVAPDGGGPFAARAAHVAPLEKELSRALKRALADEQNEVLDTLRREKPKGVDDLLPGVDLHAARWTEAVADTLRDATVAGAGSPAGTSVSVDDLANELAHALVGPLRDRIDRGFAASDGNLDDIADRVRALYREWRGQRLAETSEHFIAAAYARGAFEAIESGTKVRWVLDPSVGACPDCDDNVLAGAIDKGEAFPTGNTCAPAHPGCHCLVVPAPS